MTAATQAPAPETELKPRITVIGVGGAGGNAVNNMISSKLEGVEFLVANTDAQAIQQSLAQLKIQLGLEVTKGLGAGSHPTMGRAAAEETIADVINHIKGSNMLFITAGMGGGTGTGAAPVIAKAAREAGILTVGVVTKPFHFEGSHRMRSAEGGISELQQFVDTLIVIPNQNLFRVANEKTTFADAFRMADDVLYSGVRSVTDLMMKPGLINLDFADIRAVMGSMMGKAMMGTGEATGEDRAIQAAEAAISSPLLDDVSMRGAKAVLINITGGLDMTLYEVDEAANRIRDEVDPEANIIFGSTFDETIQGKIRVSCVATGIDSEAIRHFVPASQTQTEATAPVVEEEPEISIFEELGIQTTENTTVDPLGFEITPTVTAPQAETTPADLFGHEEHHEEESHVEYTNSLRQKMYQDALARQHPEEEPEKPVGFFQRLIGRKSHPQQSERPRQVSPDPAVLTRPKTKAPAARPTPAASSEEDMLEIPAFLRRKGK
ncbi:Cell division protein FtsZ [Candidatus Bealeia paramacronuclearis]|uniref:Cell division protein FtsZ n=1 Tax=Candidatus Bealeia paramacronuclearis TaxID=1921001 RepID=A0ABZ2C131_9PROT|nr:Cell division protein FtsZ [Candidatus Bealeia paramacronuclearis]